MDAYQVEFHATETLLERGIRVKARAPFLFRLFRKKTVTLTLYQPTGGALLRMGYWYLQCQHNIDELEEMSVNDALKFNLKYGDCIYNAVACLFLKDKLLTKLFLKPFSRWLRESLTVKDVLNLISINILHGGTKDFIVITRLVRAKMISLPNLGQ